MKKTSLILSLLLLFAGGLWAEEEEFPIELTCEINDLIIYLSLTNKAETSWWMNHPSNSDLFPGKRDRLKGSNWQGKKFKMSDIGYGGKYILGKEKIEFAIKGLGSPYAPYFINRLSGGISTPSGTNAGLCHKGFKEYKDRKF